MQFDDEVMIDAPAQSVWRVYADVERWPEWTASIRSVQFVAGTAVAPGACVEIAQPKLPRAKWSVAHVDEGRSWTWEARGPGMRTTAIHTVTAVDEHSTRVHQTLVQQGPLGALFGRLYAGLTRRYLAMEASGLKQRCEARTPA